MNWWRYVYAYDACSSKLAGEPGIGCQRFGIIKSMAYLSFE
jgi:hypothetical protein